MLLALLAAVLVTHTVRWQDLPQTARPIAAELGFTEGNFDERIRQVRGRNQARLREGEVDHLIFYMLQSAEFTKEPPMDSARAAMNEAVARRMGALIEALRRPSTDRQRYFATLLPADPKSFLEAETARVLSWIRKKEVECQSASSPQSCIAALYESRGHSSDTSPQSMAAVKAAFDWLKQNRPSPIRRVLILGPGADFAPRTGTAAGAIASYQPAAVRTLLRADSVVDCADLNPRVLKTVAGECASTVQLDISVEAIAFNDGAKYDAIIATNLLLYLNQTELFLAMRNIGSMLAPDGVFIHNDSRFEANVFGRAFGIPVIQFGSVVLDAARKPVLTDRFVIHSRSAEPAR
jgi:hypothetical protein